MFTENSSNELTEICSNNLLKPSKNLPEDPPEKPEIVKQKTIRNIEKQNMIKTAKGREQKEDKSQKGQTTWKTTHEN